MRKSDMEVLFSSDKMDWETPQAFFDKLNNMYNFNLDPCASADTAKCEKYYTESELLTTQSLLLLILPMAHLLNTGLRSLFWKAENHTLEL